MSTEIQTKTAACLQADHHTQSALALVWVFPHGSRRWGEIFASVLDRRLREKLPDYSLSDPLNGLEAEIRQRAAILLLERFFTGNPRLKSATDSGDWYQVINQLERSINAALRISIKRLRTAILRERRCFESFDEKLLGESFQIQHPANRLHLFELPTDAQRSLLMMLLSDSADSKKIPRESERLIHQMLEEGLSQAQMAEREGVSRQAIHQRLDRAALLIRKAVETTEFPLT